MQKRNGFLTAGLYFYDGYSGTNYDRPHSDSLSRTYRTGKCQRSSQKRPVTFGRNYLETGTYIEVFFPNHNVRYIAINDGWTP